MFVVMTNKYEKLNTLILCTENTLVVGPNVMYFADWTRRLDSQTGLTDWFDSEVKQLLNSYPGIF